MIVKRGWCALMGGFALTASVAAAQDAPTEETIEIAEPTATFPNFDIAELEKLLTDAGADYRVESYEDDGDPYILVEEPSGFLLWLEPQLCQADDGKSDCGSLLMMTLYGEFVDPAVIRSFNEQIYWSKAYSNEEFGDTFLVRYLIGDFGYVRGSFLRDYQSFAYSAVDLRSRHQATQNGDNSAETASETAEAESWDPAPANVAPGVTIPGDNAAAVLNARQSINDAAKMENGFPSAKDRIERELRKLYNRETHQR